MGTLGQGMTHVPGGQRGIISRLKSGVHLNRMDDSLITGVFYLMFSDHVWLWVMNPESEPPGQGEHYCTTSPSPKVWGLQSLQRVPGGCLERGILRSSQRGPPAARSTFPLPSSPLSLDPSAVTSQCPHSHFSHGTEEAQYFPRDLVLRHLSLAAPRPPLVFAQQ